MPHLSDRSGRPVAVVASDGPSTGHVAVGAEDPAALAPALDGPMRRRYRRKCR